MNSILRRLSNSHLNSSSSAAAAPRSHSPTPAPVQLAYDQGPYPDVTAYKRSSRTRFDDDAILSALVSDNYQSPNAIPTRTSSARLVHNGVDSDPLQPSPQRYHDGQHHVPTKRASTSVLRPIAETDWLSQGRRVGADGSRKVSSGSEPRRRSSRQIMGDGARSGETNGVQNGMQNGVHGTPGRNGTVEDLYDFRPNMNDSPRSKFSMAEPLPARTSSRHKASSSMESKTSSKAGVLPPSKPTSSSGVVLSSPPPPPPPLHPLRYADELIHRRRQALPADKERILLGPYEYLLGHPGKDIRSTLISAFNQWLRVPDASLKVITKVVGMLHTASLLIDDVEDSSHLRRGVPVAHAIFGTPQTINSANYVYFLALQQLSNLPGDSSLAIRIYTEELLNLHRGQGLDLFWRDTLTCPTEQEYLDMVNDKTGGLFRLAVRLMQSQSRVGVDCVPLVNTIGLYFQVLDDYLNLVNSSYKERKGLAEDLTEGKFSFPIIYGVRADEGNLTLLSILKQKTNDEDVKRWAVGYMERVGAFRHCREVMEVLFAKAEEKVAEVEAAVAGGEVGGGDGGGDVEGGRRGADGVRAILRKMKVEYGTTSEEQK